MAGVNATEQDVFNRAGMGTPKETPPPATPTTPDPPPLTPSPTVPPTNGTPQVTVTPTATTPAPTTPATPDAPPSEPKDVEIKFGGAEAAPALATPTWNPKDVIGIDIAPEEAVNRIKSYETLEQKVKDYESKNPYANDYIKDLNAAVASGISKESFDKVYNADPDKLTPIEKVVLQLQWQKGIKEADAKLIVEDEYHLGVAETEDMTDAQKAEVQRLKSVGNAKLNAAAKDADNFLREHKAQTLTPPADQSAAIVAANEKAWTPVLPEMTSRYAVCQIGDAKIESSAEELKAIENIALNTLKLHPGNVDPNSDYGKRLVGEIIDETWKVRNFERTIQQINRTYEVKYANLLLQYKSNPSGNGSSASQQQVTPDAPTSYRQQILEATSKGY